MKQHQDRQLFATMSSHKAHLFSIELSEEELKSMKEQIGKPHGLAEVLFEINFFEKLLKIKN